MVMALRQDELSLPSKRNRVIRDSYGIMETINELMWAALIVAAVLFILSGVDDLITDCFYWGYLLYRKIKTKSYRKLVYSDLSSKKEKRIALMIPCWQEDHVIADMLNHNLTYIDYANYDVFVGLYKNDLDTINVVRQQEGRFYNVHAVISERAGPTNKADNLNSVLKFISQREKQLSIKYDIFVMHDTEDVIHPLELKLFNYLMPRKDMIQTPIFPLETGLRHWTYWTYCDEFAETHTKELVIREALKSFVPSAGVGTAFSRASMDYLSEKNKGLPFNTKSVTEDYDVSLRLRLAKTRVIFLLQSVERVQDKKSFFGKKTMPKQVRDIVATRAMFPMTYHKSVHQRSRWAFGIVLKEWANFGWHGNFIMRYFL